LDEVAELHGLAGRGLAAMFGGAESSEVWLTRAGVMALSGEAVADLNMLLLCQPPDEARRFLEEAMARADARGLPLVALMAPAVTAELASAAPWLGLTAAGTMPLMVLRGAPTAGPAPPCRIERVTTSEAGRAAGELLAAAFDLPLDAAMRSAGAIVGPAANAELFVAYEGETPVSTVTVSRSGDTAGIWSMATPPKRQGRGLGRALLTGVIERCRVAGVERFYLFATAAGRPLYERLGFVAIADEAVWAKGHSTQASQ
jgi:GNAT superfamily N-acetyltransferase